MRSSALGDRRRLTAPTCLADETRRSCRIPPTISVIRSLTRKLVNCRTFTSTPAATSETAATANKPVHTVRHRNIKAAIWKNQTANGTMYNVTIGRSYQDESERWHDTQSFGFDDLLVVAKLMYDAHSYINAQRSKDYALAKNGKC